MGSFLNIITAPIRALMAPFRWLFGWLTRLVGVPGKLGGMTLPMRLAVFMGIACVLTVVLAVVLANVAERAVGYVDWKTIVVILLALIVLPPLTYKVAKLFLEGTPSVFPDIDNAWQAGLAELAKNGLNLEGIPIFLVLGANDGAEADAIMDASGLDLVVRAHPPGQQPLRWYANDRAAFLACPAVGCLSLANTGRKSAAPGDGPSGDIYGTLVAGGPQTIMAGDDAAYDEPAPASPTLFGTLVAGVQRTLNPSEKPAPPAAYSDSGANRKEKQEQTARLEHIGGILKRARQPFCPLNGVLALIPWKVFDDPSAAPKDLPHSLRRDVQALNSATDLCFPVTTLVTGLEAEPGFLELTRRVPAEGRRARFGKGYQVANLTTRHNMEALATHTQGAFEDWVYKLFRDPGSLAKPGNARLYGLLCKVRSKLSSRMRNMLLTGFENRADGERFMLGGVYFAATGGSPDTQAFVKGVTDKVQQMEEDVEWMAAALARNNRFLQWSQWIFFVDCLLALAIVVLVVYVWMNPS